MWNSVPANVCEARNLDLPTSHIFFVFTYQNVVKVCILTGNI